MSANASGSLLGGVHIHAEATRMLSMCRRDVMQGWHFVSKMAGSPWCILAGRFCSTCMQQKQSAQQPCLPHLACLKILWLDWPYSAAPCCQASQLLLLVAWRAVLAGALTSNSCLSPHAIGPQLAVACTGWGESLELVLLLISC